MAAHLEFDQYLFFFLGGGGICLCSTQILQYPLLFHSRNLSKKDSSNAWLSHWMYSHVLCYISRFCAVWLLHALGKLFPSQDIRCPWFDICWKFHEDWSRLLRTLIISNHRGKWLMRKSKTIVRIHVSYEGYNGLQLWYCLNILNIQNLAKKEWHWTLDWTAFFHLAVLMPYISLCLFNILIILL